MPLTEYQVAYLDDMDKKMDDGIDIDGEKIASPELNQKVQFITANLVSAITEDNEGMTIAMCTYLA